MPAARGADGRAGWSVVVAARALGIGAWLATRRREEIALLGVAVAAWSAWLALSVASGATWGGPGAAGHRHPLTAAGTLEAASDAAAPTLGSAASAAGLGAGLAMWAFMAAAMMLPTALPSVRYVADVSRPARRAAMVATFAGAYLAAWLALGAVVLAATAAAIAVLGAPTRAVLVAATVAAALWELAPAKRVALARCCRTAPIRLRGAAAYRSAGAFGLRNGLVCVVACGPAMTVLALAGHPLVASIVVASLLAAEKLWRRGARLRVWACAAGLLLAAAAVTAG
ncbi:copper chaperone [Agromyces sp. ZXT2-3]|uniref:copper chaperone n=1 Tax=Agromyces sp. ZXT2-3 TaxID=3461152 RepID=UPI004054E91C